MHPHDLPEKLLDLTRLDITDVTVTLHAVPSVIPDPAVPKTRLEVAFRSLSNVLNKQKVERIIASIFPESDRSLHEFSCRKPRGQRQIIASIVYDNTELERYWPIIRAAIQHHAKDPS